MYEESVVPSLIDRDSLPLTDNVNTRLALLNSGTPDCNYGLIEDTLMIIGWQPGKGEIVGQWNRIPSDNTIYLFLTTSLKALDDRGIEMMKRLVTAISDKKIRTTKSPSTPRVKKVGVKEVKADIIPEPPSHPHLLEGFEAMREKLRGKKIAIVEIKVNKVVEQ